MSKLARPRWRVGQVLHPRHLLALEDALAAEAALYAAVAGLPAYGVMQLGWEGVGPENKTADKQLSLEKLTAIFPHGAVVDVPGNATVRGPLDLKPEIDVFVHLVDPEEDGEEEEEDPVRPSESKKIERREHDLLLSSSPELKGSHDRLRLGRVELDDRGRYRFDEMVMPPLLRIEGSAALQSRLDKVRRALGELDGKLDRLATDAVSKGRPLAPIQRVRIESRKLGALLADLAGDRKQRRAAVPLHPYVVFSALRAFSIELCVLDETKPLEMLPAYDHDELAPCFKEVCEAISSWIAWSPLSSEGVQFVLDGSRFVATLPDDALTASEVYVVVLKREETDVVPFDRVRLASPRRLSLVREYAIHGVPFKRDLAPRFQFGFSGGAEFYGYEAKAPGKEPREWDHVLTERAIAFQASSQLEAHRFVLCWRRP